MNYVNYFNHIITPPATYHRRYDLDLPQEGPPLLKRIALATLPFLSLYRPLGSALSIGLGSCRALSHLSNALTLEGNRNWTQCDLEVSQAALAALAVATTFYNFTAGLYITTAVDLSQGIKRTISHVSQQEYKKAAEEALQSTASAFYLGFMATGALEAILLSTLIQASLSALEAHNEWKEGRYIEAAAKFAMGAVRLRQAHSYSKLIQRRNQLLKIQKYADLARRALKGRQVRHLIQSPLADRAQNIDSKRVTLSNQNESFDFGSHLHGYGGATVKGANLAFRTLTVDGKETFELQFKVNHAFRDQLQSEITGLAKLNSKEMKEVLSLTGSHVTDIRVKSTETDFHSWELNTLGTTTIQLMGLGELSLGADRDLPNLYDRITVRLDADKTIYDLHEILSFTDLDCALRPSTHEDLEKLKLGHLFRIFFPREALTLERTAEFFTLTFEQLKAKIFDLVPQMADVYAHYFHRIQAAEILPGRIRYRIEGLADEVRKAGGRALTAAITGAYGPEEELFSRIASILSIGMISSETRDNYGMNAEGLGSAFAYLTGGADSVFMQMLTEKNAQDNLDLDNLYYSKARMLISLDLLETGTYQYLEDQFGTRSLDDFWGAPYKSRPSILEFTTQVQQETDTTSWWWEFSGHEVMAKERVDPSYFTGIILENNRIKTDLIKYLRARDLIQKDAAGNETILNIALDRFFRVGTHVTPDLIA